MTIPCEVSEDVMEVIELAKNEGFEIGELNKIHALLITKVFIPKGKTLNYYGGGSEWNK